MDTGPTEHPAEPSAPIELHITVVEDDAFQQAAVCELIKTVLRSIEIAIVPHLTVTATASGALELATQDQVNEQERAFKVARLFLLDYLLPGDFNADQLISPLRAKIGKEATIMMVSGPSRVSSLTQCISDGADAYRLKPMSMGDIREIITYTIQKFRFVEASSGSRSRSPLCSGLTLRILDGLEHTLAHGRRTPTYIAESGGTPVAIKTMVVETLRGPPPPHHPHVNRVVERLHEALQGKWYEVRELAEGGEFFDIMADHEDGCRPADVVKFMVQLVDAVAHCHANGAVHGQLLPENVLLRGSLLQVTGFYCHTGSDFALRPYSRLYAPELEGKEVADAQTLAAADIWSLGQLLVLLMTGVHEELIAAAQKSIEVGHITAAMSALVASSSSSSADGGEGCGLRSSRGEDSPGGSTTTCGASSSSSSLSATPGSHTPPVDVSEQGHSTATARPLPEWQRRIARPSASSPRNRDELVRTALRTLANLMLRRDPTKRPTASNVLSDLGNIQMMLP